MGKPAKCPREFKNLAGRGLLYKIKGGHRPGDRGRCGDRGVIVPFSRREGNVSRGAANDLAASLAFLPGECRFP
jgi:hypothetical protein